MPKKNKGKLFIVSAPSGTGKTSLVNVAVQKLGQQYNIIRLVTYTSKQPRFGEQPGKDYHFISVQEFEDKISQNFFLEWSNEYGHYYGSPRQALELLGQGCSPILILDRRGAHTVKTIVPETVLIWLSTLNYAVIEQRLRSRNTENEEEIIRRLDLARQEIVQEERFRLFPYHILNDDLERALSDLEEIIKKELQDDILGF